MSQLAIAVQAVVTATPVPSPATVTIIKEVTPEWVGQLATVLKHSAELGLLVLPGLIGSKLHSLADTKFGFKAWTNALLLFGYSAVLAVLSLIASDALNLTTVNWHSPEALGAALLTVIGAASSRYAVVSAQAKKEAAKEVTPATAALTQL